MKIVSFVKRFENFRDISSMTIRYTFRMVTGFTYIDCPFTNKPEFKFRVTTIKLQLITFLLLSKVIEFFKNARKNFPKLFYFISLVVDI